MQHQPDISFDESLILSSLTIRDISSYAPNIPLSNPVLEIMPPDSVASVVFSDLVAPGWVKTLNLTTLHLNSGGIFPLPALPDGNYYVRYSVSPNLRTYIAYNHYRVDKLLYRYLTLCSEFLKNRTNFSSSFYNKKIAELLSYHQYILAAKFQAEENQDVVAADRMYTEINHTLTKFNTCQGC